MFGNHGLYVGGNFKLPYINTGMKIVFYLPLRELKFCNLD